MRLRERKCMPFFIIRKKSKKDAQYQVVKYFGGKNRNGLGDCENLPVLRETLYYLVYKSLFLC
jgi:hypothetical protein